MEHRAALFILVLLIGSPAAAADTPGANAGEAYAVAEGLLARKMYGQAARAYDSFVSRFPDHKQVHNARYRSAEAWRLAGEPDAALERYRVLHEHKPGAALEAAATFREGQVLYLTGQYQAAIGALRLHQRLKDKTYRAAAGYYLGRALEHDGNREGAAESLAAVELTKDPAYGPAALWALGSLHRERGRPERAARAYLDLARDHGDHELAAEAALRAGEIYRGAGKDGKAIDAYGVAIARGKGGPHAHAARYGRAAALLARGEHEEAAKQAHALAQDQKASRDARAGALLIAGSAMLAGGRNAAAERTLSRVAREFAETPLAPLAAARRLWALERLGRHAEALQAAGNLLADERSAAHAVEIRYVAARCALALNKERRALELLEEAARGTGPLAAISAFRLGERLERAGRFREAGEAFDRILAAHRAHALEPLALASAGAAYLAAGSHELAIARSASLVDGFPESPYRVDCLWNIALALAAKADFDGMGERLDQLLALEPKGERAAEALYAAAWSHLRRGRLRKAAARIEKLLQDHADSPRAADARLRLAMIHHEQGDANRAAWILDAVLRTRAPAPVPPRLLLWLAAYHLDHGQLDRGRKAVDAILQGGRKIEPAVREAALLTDGQIHLAQKSWPGAIGSFARLIRSFPPESSLVARAMYGKARAHLALDELDRAQTLLVNTRASGLLRAKVTLELGRVLARRGDHREAVRHFMRVAILYEPQDQGGPVALCAEALLLAAESLAELGEREAARARFAELIGHRLYKDTEFAGKAKRRRGYWRRRWKSADERATGTFGERAVSGSEEER